MKNAILIVTVFLLATQSNVWADDSDSIRVVCTSFCSVKYESRTGDANMEKRIRVETLIAVGKGKTLSHAKEEANKVLKAQCTKGELASALSFWNGGDQRTSKVFPTMANLSCAAL